MKQIRVGVIGVGRMGQHHCRVYSGMRQVEFVGIVDTNAESASKTAQRYDIKAFDSVDALLKEVDAVSITTPTPPHYDLVMQALDAGVHVLVEKPLVETLDQAAKITERAEKSDRVVQVGHIERFNPTYVELQHVLENMPPLIVNFRRLSPFKGSNTDVDVVLDLMIHDLDLVLNLMQSEPVSIAASGLKLLSENIDHAVAQMTFPSGQIVTLAASRITEQKIRSVDITTRCTYVEADLLNKTVLVHRRSSGEYVNNGQSTIKYRQESIVERILVPTVEPLLSEIQHFVQCVVDQSTPAVTPRDGYRALCLAHTIRDLCLKQQKMVGIPVNG